MPATLKAATKVTFATPATAKKHNGNSHQRRKARRKDWLTPKWVELTLADGSRIVFHAARMWPEA